MSIRSLDRNLKHEAPKSSETRPELLNSRTAGDFELLRRSFGFWAIIVGLGIMLLLSALEKSVLSIIFNIHTTADIFQQHYYHNIGSFYPR